MKNAAPVPMGGFTRRKPEGHELSVCVITMGAFVLFGMILAGLGVFFANAFGPVPGNEGAFGALTAMSIGGVLTSSVAVWAKMSEPKEIRNYNVLRAAVLWWMGIALVWCFYAWFLN